MKLFLLERRYLDQEWYDHSSFCGIYSSVDKAKAAAQRLWESTSEECQQCAMMESSGKIDADGWPEGEFEITEQELDA